MRTSRAGRLGAALLGAAALPFACAVTCAPRPEPLEAAAPRGEPRVASRVEIGGRVVGVVSGPGAAVCVQLGRDRDCAASSERDAVGPQAPNRRWR